MSPRILALSLALFACGACSAAELLHVTPPSARQVHINVLGAVEHPGTLALDEGDTVLDAVQLARPRTWAADMAHVRLRRASTSDEFTIDIAHMLETGDTSQNLHLQEGDEIVVPSGTPSAR